MNKKERVLKALAFEEPDRVPIDFGSYPGASSINVKAYKNLLKHLGIERNIRVAFTLLYTADIDEIILNRFNVDTQSAKPSVSSNQFDAPEEVVWEPYQVTWRRCSDFTYGPVKGPFQIGMDPDIDSLKKFKWPEPKDIEDHAIWKEKTYMLRKETDRAIVARMPTAPFVTAQWVRGFEGWCTDFYVNKKFSDMLHDTIIEIWLRTMDNLIASVEDRVDIWILGEDLGLQNQLMVSPELFHTEIGPRLKKMIQYVKSKSAAKIALHSCGSVFDLIEDFIDIGFDILNPLQSTAQGMDPIKIKKKAGKNLALWGGIDTHEILPKGTTQDVRDEVKRKIEIYGEGGGYIFAPDHNILVDVPPKNVVAMFEAAVEFGRY